MVIELLCAYRNIYNFMELLLAINKPRNRCHNEERLTNYVIDIAFLNWKNHELGQQFVFSSLLPLPAGFSSSAMPPEFGSFIFFPTKILIKISEI